MSHCLQWQITVTNSASGTQQATFEGLGPTVFAVPQVTFNVATRPVFVLMTSFFQGANVQVGSSAANWVLSPSVASFGTTSFRYVAGTLYKSNSFTA